MVTSSELDPNILAMLIGLFTGSADGGQVTIP